MLSSERISNLFDKIISTLIMDVYMYEYMNIWIYAYMDIYRILVQFKIVCLFPLDFSIQNVLCKYTYVMLKKKTCKMIYFPPWIDY